MRVFRLFIILAFSFTFIGLMDTTKTYCKNQSNFAIKINFYANFIKNKYEPYPGTKPLKLPVRINSWPGQFFDTAPDTIEVSAEIFNNSNYVLKELVFNLAARYKSGKIIENQGIINIEESKKNLKWNNDFYVNTIQISSIKPKSKVTFGITKFNIIDDIKLFNNKNERPWQCEIKISMIQPTKKMSSKILPIDLIPEY